MSEQLVPSAVVQSIVTFLTNENVKPADILKRFSVEFGDETLSRAQIYDWSKSFKEDRKMVENMRTLHLLQEK
jgi:hypothetical protein